MAHSAWKGLLQLEMPGQGTLPQRPPAFSALFLSESISR
jgi:hypothetical protein